MITPQKPLLAPMHSFLGTLGMIVAGTLCRYRMLPFLQADTVLSHGQQVPAEHIAHFLSNAFYGIAAFAFLTGVIGLLTLDEARRQYIAQLPRWQQWLIWPSHGASAAPSPTSLPAA